MGLCERQHFSSYAKKFEMIIGPKLDRVNRPLDQKSRQFLIFRLILQNIFTKWPPLLDLAAVKWA